MKAGQHIAQLAIHVRVRMIKQEMEAAVALGAHTADQVARHLSAIQMTSRKRTLPLTRPVDNDGACRDTARQRRVRFFDS